MNYLLLTIVFIVWALVHSLTAARPVKQAVRNRIGPRPFDGFYRLFYNLFSLITIVPLLLLLATAIPFQEVWRWPGWSAALAVAVQLVGMFGLLASLWQTDVWAFAGLRQVWRYLEGAPDPNPSGPFVNRGTYALVRHPLYFFSLLVIWFTPVMTLNNLIFALLATLYFWIGSLHEERRLLREYGESYRRYQQEVPHMVPFIKR